MEQDGLRPASLTVGRQLYSELKMSLAYRRRASVWVSLTFTPVSADDSTRAMGVGRTVAGTRLAFREPRKSAGTAQRMARTRLQSPRGWRQVPSLQPRHAAPASSVAILVHVSWKNNLEDSFPFFLLSAEDLWYLEKKIRKENY